MDHQLSQPPSRKMPGTAIKSLGQAWLGSDWLADRIAAKVPGWRGKIYPKDPDWEPRFTAEECRLFGEYVLDASIYAPTHGLFKMAKQLVPDLGVEHGGCVPNIDIEVRPKHFKKEPCQRWNTRRKLGVVVMAAAIKVLIEEVQEYGIFQIMFHEAGHFGYGGLWARQLADEGLIVLIENTAGRGNEVIPFGGKDPRMGTNPRTFALPTKNQLGYHVCLDSATSPISFGTLGQAKMLGTTLPDGCVVDEAGEVTQDPRQGRYIRHTDHKACAWGLYVEAIAAAMAGGIARERCVAQGAEPGGGANWMVTVAFPEYFSCTDGNPVDRMVTNLRDIISDNGQARLPGSNYAGNERNYRANGDCVIMQEAELVEFAKISEQANVPFNAEDFEVIG